MDLLGQTFKENVILVSLPAKRQVLQSISKEVPSLGKNTKTSDFNLIGELLH